MGYLPNVLPSPFSPIGRQVNNASNGLSNIAKQVISAEQQIGKQAIDGENLVLNQAYKAIGSPRISIDPCNVVIQSDIGSFTFRNSACNPPNLQQPSPPPPPGSFFIPPNGCTQTVTFAFIDSNGILIGGADKFSYFVDGGKVPFPSDTETQGDASNVYGQGLQEFKYDASLVGVPSIRQTNILLDGVAYRLFSASISYTDIKLTSTAGIVSPPLPLYLFNSSYVNAPWTIVNIDTGSCIPYTPINPPPPPKEKKCMCCCDDNNSPVNNSNLLKLILQRIGNLPASVPDNFASAKPTQITLGSLAEMLIWQAQQMDALAGQYPIPLTIKADPTDPKSKDQQLSLPNQAETLAEILGLLITTKRDTHATLVGVIKALGEAGMIKNLSQQTFDVAMANAEFLGYKLEQKTKTIPSMITPNAPDLTTTFTATNVDIVSYVNNDTTDLQDDLKKLLMMAARWNAQNWRAIGNDVLGSLKNNFTGNPTVIANTHQAIKEETFATFLQEVQQGFTKTYGVTDNTDPWGNPANEAPIIRELGSPLQLAAEQEQNIQAQAQQEAQILSRAAQAENNIQQIVKVIKSL